MVDIKNATYIAYNPDVDCTWILRVPVSTSDERTQSQVVREATESLLEVTREYFEYTDFSITTYGFDPSTTFEELTTDFSLEDRTDHKELSIRSDLVIDAEDIDQILSLSETSVSGWPFVTGLSLTGRFRFEFSDTKYVGIDSDYYKYWADGERYRNQPEENPVSIDVEFSTVEPDLPCLKFIIRTNTDVWFEENEMGEDNREILGDMFYDILDTFSVTEIDYYSERYSDPFELEWEI